MSHSIGTYSVIQKAYTFSMSINRENSYTLYIEHTYTETDPITGETVTVTDLHTPTGTITTRKIGDTETVTETKLGLIESRVTGSDFTYSTSLQIMEGNNTIKYILTNANALQINVYYGYFDTITTSSILTSIIGTTVLEATDTVTIHDLSSTDTTLKFVGWYMIDPETAEQKLVAYDNKLTISASTFSEGLKLVKKYDDVGNNNLIPSESKIYANITDELGSSEIIEDEDKLIGLTLNLSDDGAECMLDASEFLRLAQNNGLAFTGFYKNGLLLSTFSSFKYTISKGISQVVEARFTKKAIEFSASLQEGETLSSTFTPSTTITPLIKNELQDIGFGYLYSMQDAIVSVTLPKGYILSTEFTKVYADGEEYTSETHSISIINNEKGSSCATIIVPYKLVEELIKANKQLLEVKVAFESYKFSHTPIEISVGGADKTMNTHSL